MYRIISKPIIVPDTVNISIDEFCLICTGPKGISNIEFPQCLILERIDAKLHVSTIDKLNKQQTILGATYRQLINNMVLGVSLGFSKTLILEGVGYRASLDARNLILSLGFSHQIIYELPFDVKAVIEGNNKIILSCHEKRLLGQTAAEIKQFRPPEPYKGKGIRFEGEIIRKKAGKTGKK